VLPLASSAVTVTLNGVPTVTGEGAETTSCVAGPITLKSLLVADNVFAGVKPVGAASTPTSRFVYVTDFSQNELIAYSVLDGGVLHPLINGPFKTGNQPSAITVDPRGIYIYISNELDNTVSAYELALPTGTPSAAVNTSLGRPAASGVPPVKPRAAI